MMSRKWYADDKDDKVKTQLNWNFLQVVYQSDSWNDHQSVVMVGEQN